MEVHTVWLAALTASQEEGTVLGGAKGGSGEGRGDKGRQGRRGESKLGRGWKESLKGREYVGI